MIVSEFKLLKKEQLKRRVKIFNVSIYFLAATGIASIVVFFITHYKFNWSWLLIGVTYILMSINFIRQMRRMRKELRLRGVRLKQKQEAPKNISSD